MDTDGNWQRVINVGLRGHRSTSMVWACLGLDLEASPEWGESVHGEGGNSATPLFTKNCQDNDKSEAVGPHGECYAVYSVYKIEKYGVYKLDGLPY